MGLAQVTERPVIRTRKRCLEDARLANAAFDAEVFGAKDDARVMGQLETLKSKSFREVPK